jgi:2-oxoisovalerate dehydrogenase E1 component
MGQDVAEYGGAFQNHGWFCSKVWQRKVINTPICESAVVSAGMGFQLMDIKQLSKCSLSILFQQDLI